jgi:hypothetical protein
MPQPLNKFQLDNEGVSNAQNTWMAAQKLCSKNRLNLHKTQMMMMSRNSKCVIPSAVDDNERGRDFRDLDLAREGSETSSPFKFASFAAKASFDIVACGFPSAVSRTSLKHDQTQ